MTNVIQNISFMQSIVPIRFLGAVKMQKYVIFEIVTNISLLNLN